MNERRGKQITCPTCKKTGDWFAGKYGPFCSQRCRLIDLGKWFGGEHAISEPLKAEHFAELEDEENSKPSGDNSPSPSGRGPG